MSVFLNAFALKEDAAEKIYIVADATLYNSSTGITTFLGHVKVDQGSTHLLADRLVTQSDNHYKIQLLTAWGEQSLAHYWTLPTVKEKELHAYATMIKFYPLDSNVTLEHNVTLTQGENTFRGELIHYNGLSQTINVPASSEGHASLVYDSDNETHT
jgi:lipopolysaccharide export system protein LptA